MIAICATLSDADSLDDFAVWGRIKEVWLRRFLVLKNVIPSQDTFLRVFEAIDPKQFEAVFRRWVSGIIKALDGTIAIDGKSLRGSGDGENGLVHMVSAFATDLGLVLGQEKVAAGGGGCLWCLVAGGCNDAHGGGVASTVPLDTILNR